ncbi:MAG: phosphoribosylformylglycinamidine cyclo-ligase [Deltaproteobacteria bacterium]|jgi:phosphoribosylformylglycinamidine cyclo-ligase|nr:phosphoribosylformylglycinamidine cyclo-ligase [Deltaproteobacteria bacterium]
MAKKTLLYKDAGVDIEAGERFVQLIKPLAQRTFTPGVRGGLGGFAALFAPDLSAYERPVLVASTDGVGTKLKVASLMGRYDTIGIDLVAMCVNDVVVTGAVPLFFLDYFATAHLDVERGVEIMKGVAQGCLEAGCALVGGETAEMPGFYPAGEFEMAGFVVGVVDEAKIIDGTSIRPGDAIIGLASHGLHSNGYSLARRVLLDELKLKLDAKVAGLSSPLGEELLRPTRIYVKTILSLLPSFHIKGMAHITGGGMPGNTIRILPAGSKAVIKKARWEIPPIFKLIEKGSVPEEEMWRTFNNGIGMALVVAAAEAEGIVHEARHLGEDAFVIGEVVSGQGVEIV